MASLDGSSGSFATFGDGYLACGASCLGGFASSFGSSTFSALAFYSIGGSSTFFCSEASFGFGASYLTGDSGSLAGTSVLGGGDCFAGAADDLGSAASLTSK